MKITYYILYLNPYTSSILILYLSLPGQASGFMTYRCSTQRSDDCDASSISRDDFTIVGRDKNLYILTVKESIFISTSKPQVLSLHF